MAHLPIEECCYAFRRGASAASLLLLLRTSAEDGDSEQDGEEEHHGSAQDHEHVLDKAGDEIADKAHACDKERIGYLSGDMVYMVTLGAR